MLSVSKRLAAAAVAPALVLTGCYVVPINPDGTPAYPYPYAYGTPPYTVVPAPPVVAAGRLPAQLNARLYPINDVATQTGVMTGSVTNMMNGKGRFQLDYQGETSERRGDAHVGRRATRRRQRVRSARHVHELRVQDEHAVPGRRYVHAVERREVRGAPRRLTCLPLSSMTPLGPARRPSFRAHMFW